MLWGGGGHDGWGENVTGDVERGRFRAVGRSGSAGIVPRGCVGGWTMLYGPYRGSEIVNTIVNTPNGLCWCYHCLLSIV